MSSSNTSPLDPNLLDPQVAAEQREQRKRKIQSSLAKRHRKEKTFRFAGISAVVIALAFVALLFGSILAKGLPSFWQSSMTVPVYFDPAIINVGAKPKQTAGETPAHFEERMVAWQTETGKHVSMMSYTPITPYCRSVSSQATACLAPEFRRSAICFI